MIEHQVYLEFPRVKDRKDRTSNVRAPVVERLAPNCTRICSHAFTEGSLSPVWAQGHQWGLCGGVADPEVTRGRGAPRERRGGTSRECRCWSLRDPVQGHLGPRPLWSPCFILPACRHLCSC